MAPSAGVEVGEGNRLFDMFPGAMVDARAFMEPLIGPAQSVVRVNPQRAITRNPERQQRQGEPSFVETLAGAAEVVARVNPDGTITHNPEQQERR